MRDLKASSSSFRCSYHVFLSFRGKDTRSSFTDHLYTALNQAGFHTFRDDDELPRGENIESQLHRAIRESRISIIVFSENYVSSRWCLDELVTILEHKKKTTSHIILPVFYHVDPSQVKKQTGSFAKALADHQERLKAEACEIKDNGLDMVRRWTKALEEVGGLAGMHLKDGYESDFIKEIVEQVGNKLKLMVLNVAKYPVGIEGRVWDINLWLQDISVGVGIAAICGIGGIGKSTIAKAVYNQNYASFEASSFLANIKETSRQPNGLIRLQKQLISNISKRKKERISSIDAGIMEIKDVVCCKRVLIVLDDVDQEGQLDAVVGMRDWFCQGSKIIITTRYQELLKKHEAYQMFQVEAFDYVESLRLFSWHAFRQAYPSECYENLANKIVRHCGGIPLALVILGSSLSGESVDVWESALKKLEKIFDNRIFQVLKISFDSLPDDHEKRLFLDIACFFVGKDKDFTVKILDECDFYTTVGIANLINRCLITVDGNNKLMMHQLLQDMGREIVRRESPCEPGKRSRVWHHNDALKILKEKTGTKTIQGLILALDNLKRHEPVEVFATHKGGKRQSEEDILDKSVLSLEGRSLKRRRLDFFSWLPIASASTAWFCTLNEVDLEASTFSRMPNIKLLQLNYARVTGGYEEFPKELRWLYWRGFPLKCIPANFRMENLVALEMPNSSLVQVWRGTKLLRLLKILNLSHSHGLTSSPDFSGLPNLERLNLKYCTNLVKLHESIGVLARLLILNLKGCKNLTRLSSEVAQLKSLETLILSGCSKLRELPMELGKMESLRELFADGTAINQSPSSTGDLKNVCKISMKSLCSLFWSKAWPTTSPKSTNFSLALLPSSLKILNLADCNLTDDAIPIHLGNLSSLQHLNLGGNLFSCLPDSIRSLTMLKSLILSSCVRLQSLPELPESLEKLDAQTCASLERITNLPNMLTSLDLILRGCNALVEVRSLLKLEPIANFDAEMVEDLGLADLELTRNTKVELYNMLTNSIRKGPVQVLHEFGIFSTFLPGIQVPDWFSIKSAGSSPIYFVCPSLNVKIRAISLCAVYNRSPIRFGVDSAIHIYMRNKSKGWQWNYSPTVCGRPKDDEYMVWLSHWKSGNKLEGGDKVEFRFYDTSEGEVMETGVHLFYDDDDNELDNKQKDMEIIQQNAYPSFDHKAYHFMNQAYLLSHHSFGMHQRFYETVISDTVSENLKHYFIKMYYPNYFDFDFFENHSPWFKKKRRAFQMGFFNPYVWKVSGN